MISPSDIKNVVFEKGIKGYKQDAVDAFLDRIADDLGILLNENKELENKINILAEKLEEYKSDEDSLRDALLGAQKLGANVIKEAKLKAENIIKEANSKSEKILLDNERKIEKEKQSIVKLQKEVSDFKKMLMKSYKEHIELIHNIPSYEIDEPEETLQDVKEYMESGQAARDGRIMMEKMEQQRSEASQKKESLEEKPVEPRKPENKEGDTIKFSINSQEQEKSEEKSKENLQSEEQNNKSKENKDEDRNTSSENRFGPLLFGEEYKIERNSK